MALTAEVRCNDCGELLTILETDRQFAAANPSGGDMIESPTADFEGECEACGSTDLVL